MDDIYNLMNPWWHGDDFDSGIDRIGYDYLINKSFQQKSIELIIGGRRTGKTTILKQVIKNLLKTTEPKRILYLQGDKQQIAKHTITEHVKNFRTMFRHASDTQIYLFIDEIQGMDGWDAELKSIYDLERIKMYVTGSTSYLIESRGNKLTGRQLTTRVAALTFPEYLLFKSYKPSPADEYLYVSYLDEYLAEGGYPEIAAGKAEPFYMQGLMEDIISRDIVRLFKVKKDLEVKTLLELISAGLGTRTSFNRLAKTAGIMVNTAKKYTGYFETAFIASVLDKWSWSVKDRTYSQKKIYFCDTGFKNALDDRKDAGARAENVLYNFLRKKAKMIGYFAESEREVDFVIDAADGGLPIESKYVDELNKDDPRLAGLRLYVKKFSPKAAYVITRSVEKKFEIEKTAVTAVPLWKILTGQAGI